MSICASALLGRKGGESGYVSFSSTSAKSFAFFLSPLSISFFPLIRVFYFFFLLPSCIFLFHLIRFVSLVLLYFSLSPHSVNYAPPPPLPKGTYCFWDGSLWRRRQGRRQTSCPLCNLNTLWNILMILGRNVDQDKLTCRIQD